MAYYPTQDDIQMLSFPEKILHVKILLLNDKFQTVYEMKHEYVSGNLSTNVNSDIRNTLSMTLGVVNKNVGISENRLLWINQFVKIYFGVQVPFKDEPVWYDKGIFVMTDYSYNAQSRLLQVNCSDLVCKLNGDVDGALEGLEHVIYEEDKFTIREAMIDTLTQLTPFTKYNIIDMPKLIPYDLEFNATDTVWTILTKLRDLYKSGCEMYFDTDGTFVCKEIASKESDPIILDDTILQNLYISEVDNGILKDIRNVSKVWGKCLEEDYFTDKCEYDASSNTYKAYYTGIALNDDKTLPTSTKFATKIPSVNTKKSPKIAIYNRPTSDGTDTLIGTYPIVDSLEQEVGINFFAGNASYVFRVRRKNMYVLGQWQIFAVNKLRNTEPTEEERLADIEKHGTKDITYTIMPDSPFAIEKIGERMRSFQGGEYDDIEAIDDCITRAEYETWKAAKIAYTVTLNMVYIPWLQGNEKLRFRLAESGEIKDWLVQSIDSINLNGTMNLTISEFQPVYNFEIVNEPDSITYVEYVESDGNQYIDTLFKPNQDTRVVVDFEVEVAPNEAKCIFGGRTEYKVNDFTFWISSATEYTTGYNTVSTKFAETSVVGRYTVDKNKNVTIIGDSTITATYSEFQSPANLFLFTNNQDGVVETRMSVIKLYSCQIYDNGVLVRDYIPSRDIDGTACLYDRVEEKYYYNSGTGRFTAPIKSHTEVEWIESTGTQYIDTGFKPNQDTRVVLDIDIATHANECSIIGSRDSDSGGNSFYLIANSNNGLFRFDYATARGNTISGVNNNGRHVIDLNKNVATIDGSYALTHSYKTFSVAHPMYIMTTNSGGAPKTGAMASAKLYSCRIYDNDTLIRDYIPVQDAKGVACLYDKLNHKYYRNAGTGEFNAPQVDYTEVEFIQSTGTQYIDTGFKPNQDTRVVAKVQYTSVSGDYCLFGARYSATSMRYDVMMTNKTLYTSYNGAGVSIGTAHTNIMDIDKNKNVTSINGATVYTDAYTAFQCPCNMYLFAENTNGSLTLLSYSRIYFCQIYDNGTLVRDFIPVRDGSGIACLYDKVTCQYYYDVAGGEFVAPEVDYTEVEFIQSTGTQYIDTGFKPNQDTRVELSMQIPTAPSTSADTLRLMGVRSNNICYQFSYYPPESSWNWFYYTGASAGTTKNTTIKVTEKIELKINGKSCSINGIDISETTDKTFQYDYSFYLFGHNNAGSLYGGEACAYKLWYCKIWDNDVLVRDYIPVIDAKGEACLYDKVNHVYCRNVGTGSFIAGQAKNVTLPKGYTRKEYIQSSGTQYIDTGFKPNQDTRVVCDCNVAGGNPPIIFGVMDTWVSNAFFCGTTNDMSNLSICYGAENYTSTVSGAGHHVVDMNKNVLSLDGDVAITCDETTFQSSYNMCLFEYNLGGKVSTKGTIAAIYSCKIYDNGTLIRDYVPCTNASGIAGLYDLVESIFYKNDGTGDFITGTTIE